MANRDAGNVGNCIECAGSAIKWNAKVAGALFCYSFFLGRGWLTQNTKR